MLMSARLSTLRVPDCARDFCCHPKEMHRGFKPRGAGTIVEVDEVMQAKYPNNLNASPESLDANPDIRASNTISTQYMPLVHHTDLFIKRARCLSSLRSKKGDLFRPAAFRVTDSAKYNGTTATWKQASTSENTTYTPSFSFRPTRGRDRRL